jgi:hypothetical protein
LFTRAALVRLLTRAVPSLGLLQCARGELAVGQGRPLPSRGRPSLRGAARRRGRRRGLAGAPGSFDSSWQQGGNRAHALARTGGKYVTAAYHIVFAEIAALPIALRLRCAGPATPVDAGTYAAVILRFTIPSVIHATGPYSGAAASVAKPVAALAIFHATALGHVLGPVSLRTIIHDGLVDRRERAARVLLINLGLQQRARHRGRRRDGRRFRRRRKAGWRRRRRRRAWDHRMLDALSLTRFVARRARSCAGKGYPGNEAKEERASTRSVHLLCPINKEPMEPMHSRAPAINESLRHTTLSSPSRPRFQSQSASDAQDLQRPSMQGRTPQWSCVSHVSP